MNRKEKLDIHVAEQRFSARFKLPLTKRQRLQKNKSITMKVKKGITASDEVHTILARIERLADVQTMKDTDNVDKRISIDHKNNGNQTKRHTNIIEVWLQLWFPSSSMRICLTQSQRKKLERSHQNNSRLL